MNQYIRRYELNPKPSEVLIAGDINYYEGESENIDVEIISEHQIEAQHYLNINDFISKKRKPFYYKYHDIIIEQKYLMLLKQLKYYFEDTNFELIIILENDYLIEKNDDIINLFESTHFESRLIEKDSCIIIKVTR